MNEKIIEQPEWETYVKPEKAYEPLIRVRKNIEGAGFVADFAADLMGVIRRRDVFEKKADGENIKVIDTTQICSSLLAGLQNNQEITFIFSGGRDKNDTTYFKWRVKGATKGIYAQEAAAGAKRLWNNLSLIFAGIRNSYCFAPVVRPEDIETAEFKAGWIGRLKPIGVSVGSGQRAEIGFTNGKIYASDSSNIIITPHRETKNEQGISAIVPASANCPGNINVAVSISAFTLPDDHIKQLAAALRWLNNGEKKQISYSGALTESTEEDDVMKGIQEALNSWVKGPLGYRISSTATSDKPIPESFMSMLARIYNCPVSISIEPIDKANLKADIKPETKSSAHTLDLQECIKESAQLPDLFPDIKTLIENGAHTVFRAPSVSTSATGILLGQIAEKASGKDIRFPRTDRSRHTYIIGATGTGKSTLLYNMLKQDIENGDGVALIDPHGDLYEDVIKIIPPERADDVVIIDPCNFERAVGINFLECNDFYKPAQMNFVASEMIKIFDRLYDLRQTGGPIFEQYMRNALALVMDNDLNRATLMDVPLLLENIEFRNYLKKNCKSEIIVDFWNNQAEKAGGDAELRNIVPYISSKLTPFINNAILRPIIGQAHSTINFRDVMDKGKILLVNLSKGMLGELDTQLLGMLIMGKIFSAGMGRVKQIFEDRRPFFVYVDEFQNFTTDSVSSLLSEARKFGICLTLANQNLAQLKSNYGKQSILDSVLGNVGTMLMMRVGILDSEDLGKYTKPELNSQDLQELPDFHVAGRLLANNCPSRPFVFRTLPMPKVPAEDISARIKTVSLLKYSKQTDIVENEIRRRRKVFES